ncbi:hypothetical protein, partial [Klebsiella aerogenes]|uniref:hypothetical protein n=1 Tax=Klebsiella aerogenes TaxID=548 RepID=UPI001954E009
SIESSIALAMGSGFAWLLRIAYLCLDHSCQDMAGNISNDIIKYWTQRYSLFSLFDRGIKLE